MADTPEKENGQASAEQAPAARQSPQSPDAKETVGDMLRKERITRRIAVETVAKDLRLNVKYIKALEANQYDALPPDPYVRVYLRSISKYLMLDSDTILRKFYESRGMSPADFSKDTMTKLDVSKIEPDRSMGLWIVIILIIAALAGVSYVASRYGGLPRSSSPAPVAADSVAAAHTDSVRAPAPASVAEDSTEVPAIPPPPADSTLDTAVADTAAPAGTGLSLSIRVMRDSAWVQVFADGVSWKKTLYPGLKTVHARDSLNVHVGNNSAVRYTLNGKPLTRFADPGVVVFKISRSGAVRQWTLAQWQDIFKGRL